MFFRFSVFHFRRKVVKDNGSEKVDATLRRRLVGSNIMFIVSLDSRFVQKPSEIHFPTIKTIIRCEWQ